MAIVSPSATRRYRKRFREGPEEYNVEPTLDQKLNRIIAFQPL